MLFENVEVVDHSADLPQFAYIRNGQDSMFECVEVIKDVEGKKDRTGFELEESERNKMVNT